MTPLERRELILRLLGLEPRLTAAQVAKLAYPTSETIVVSGKTYPKTYQSANNMLRRMAASKVIKCQSFPTTVADWFMLPATRRLQEPKYRHEVGAADLFVAFYPYAQQWAYEPGVLRDRADRGVRIFDKIFYLEVDRATESPREIEAKLENYIQYSSQSGEQFYVIFALMDGKESARARGQKLIPLLQECTRGNQFLLAHHKRLVEDPLGKYLYSPHDELYSVQSVF
jgi:Replication-relaxation